MKKTVIALSLLTLFAACKEPSSPPKAVIDNMFTAMKNGNLEEMKKFISKQDLNMLDAAEKIMTAVDSAGVKKIKARITAEMKERAKDIQYHVKNEKIDGDQAVVTVEISQKDTAAANGIKTSTQNFELVKEDNDWKIALSNPGNEMFNSMKGNMGPQKPDLKDGVGKLQKMDPDSLKMLITKGLQALDSMHRKKE